MSALYSPPCGFRGKRASYGSLCRSASVTINSRVRDMLKALDAILRTDPGIGEYNHTI
jgi:hypothetical protein